jgi:hypothetical protein
VETAGKRPGKRPNRWNFNVVRADGANDAATTLALNSLESSAERDLWVGAAQCALNREEGGERGDGGLAQTTTTARRLVKPPALSVRERAARWLARFVDPEYFYDPWNAVQVTSYALTLTSLAMHKLLDHERTSSVAACCSLALWLNLLFFMRGFPNTGPLLRMIFQIIKDMKVRMRRKEEGWSEAAASRAPAAVVDATAPPCSARPHCWRLPPPRRY